MLALYGHPFSSYCQKVLIALYEHGLAFDFRVLSPDHPENGREFADRWPLGKMPVLVDGHRQSMESSIIIEHLDSLGSGPKLIPSDAIAALEVRKMDRIFDNYVMAPMQKIVLDHLRPEGKRDVYGVEEAHALLAKSYAWLDERIAGCIWAEGENFSLADCAAAPALFYADWVSPIDARYSELRDYRARLLARPSVARAVDEARPYRKFFPPGAPDRD